MNDHIGKANFQTRAVALAFAKRCEDAGFSVYILPEFLGRTQIQWYKG